MYRIRSYSSIHSEFIRFLFQARGVCFVDADKKELWFNIEKILRKRYLEKEQLVQYLVKWEKDDQPTWEPGKRYLYNRLEVHTHPFCTTAATLPAGEISTYEAQVRANKRQKTFEGGAGAVSEVGTPILYFAFHDLPPVIWRCRQRQRTKTKPNCLTNCTSAATRSWTVCPILSKQVHYLKP